MVRHAAAGSILVYQRWISPHKGFCCAYRRLTGGRSCSEYARQTVLGHGVLTLARALPRQFARCHRAHATLMAMASAQADGEAGSEQQGKRRDNAKRSAVSDWCNGANIDCASFDVGCGTLDIGCDLASGCSW